MNRTITIGLAMLASAALGAAAVERLHAQAKPPVYQVVEIETTRKNFMRTANCVAFLGD